MFNLVHARAIDPGINDFDSLLYEAAKTLRPNGVLILGTAWPQIFSTDLKPFPATEEGEPGFTWAQKTLSAAYEAYRGRENRSIDSSHYWEIWLHNNPNYTNIKMTDQYIPIGPWPKGMDDRQKYVSELMRYNTIHVFHSFTPLVLSAGHDPDEVAHWIDSAVTELMDLRFEGYCKWRYVTAQRTAEPWIERMQSPVPIDEELGRIVVRPTPRRRDTVTDPQASH